MAATSLSDAIKSTRVRWLLGITLVALVAFAVVLLILALGLDAKNASDDGSRLQALAAVGGLLVSIVLIVVTAAYVVLTGEVVAEAREARLDAIRPSLTLRIDGINPTHSVIALVNSGQGTAIDIDITMAFHSITTGGFSHEFRWRSPSMSPGEFEQFMPENAEGAVEVETRDGEPL